MHKQSSILRHFPNKLNSIQQYLVFSITQTYPYLCPQKHHIMPDTITLTSVHTLPGTNKAAAFTPKTSEVFKEQHDIAPVFISDKMKYVPWGADNNMPYNIIDIIESDETLSTCQMFNADVCYGSGLVYDTNPATAQVKAQVDDFRSGKTSSKWRASLTA